MIAIDTNILAYAHKRGAPLHDSAARALEELAHGRRVWAIPWPCVHEFIGIVTHPRVFDPPSTLDAAVAQVEAWLESPTAGVLGEADDHLTVLARVARVGRVTGPRIHDARIAAICLCAGVTELWSADRDFGRFPDLRVRNPLLAS